MSDTAMVKQQESTETAQNQPRESAFRYTPRFDVHENENALILCGDLPGVKAENLDVEFERGELKIHARCDPRHESRQFLGREYGVGDFVRTFVVREEIDSDKIEAELKNGVLTLTLPKSEAVKSKRISVKTA